MHELFAILAGVIVCIGAPFYLFDIVHGKTKPERTTWFIWSVLGVIAFFSQKALGAHWSLLYAGIDAMGSLLVFGLSLKFGVGGWTRLDRLGLGIALCGVIIAYVANAPILAIFGIILADSAGGALTIIKTFRRPDSETTITWLGVGTSALFATLSVGRIRFGLILYPIYLMLGSYGVVVAKWSGHIAAANKRLQRAARRPRS